MRKLIPKDSEELNSLESSLQELLKKTEIEKEEVYKNLAKKFKKNDNKEKKNFQEGVFKKDKSALGKCNELMIRIPKTGINFMFYAINFAVSTPFRVVKKGVEIAKFLSWDVPLNITHRITDTFLFSPIKWINNKFNPFSY